MSEPSEVDMGDVEPDLMAGVKLSIIDQELSALNQEIYACELRAKILVRINLPDEAKQFADRIGKARQVRSGYLAERQRILEAGGITTP